MDSTTITLFSDILKGAGRNPKHGKKKGGIKAHTVTKYDESVPYLVRYTSAATHDHFMLKILELPEGSFLAIDRAYIDYEAFERMTASGTYYVTKMKKNLTYKVLESRYFMNNHGQSTYHESVVEIYARRWDIELIFKQLKQNFPLKYFYGDSVNAIKTQIWVTLIANLLLSVIKKRVQRSWCFSNLATAICHMLMHYIDLLKYLENPEQTWRNIAKEQIKQSGQLELFPT